MGSFGNCYGHIEIPENKKQEFHSYVEKLLNYGGMMQFETVSMYGRCISLLKPVTLVEDSCNYFHYNYFEDDGWETAGYDMETCRFFSGKKGSYEFSEVIMAVYTLYELFSQRHCLALEDGEIVDASRYIGWINYVLDTDFTIRHRFDLWENAELIAAYREGYDVKFEKEHLYSLFPEKGLIYAGGTDLTDLLYIINGTEVFVKEETDENSYPYDVLQCKEALSNWMNTYEEEKQQEMLISFLQKPLVERERLSRLGNDMCIIAELSTYMPARVFLYLFAEYKKEDFWELWNKYGRNMYRDERQHTYAGNELLAIRKKGINLPVGKISTADFLEQDNYFLFYDTPEELKDRGNYYLSDADMLYWWDGTDKIQFSEETENWLKEISRLHKQIIEEAISVPENRLEWMMEIFENADRFYKRIYPFQGMFYEFIQNLSQKEFVAAIELFRRLSMDEKNRESGKYIDKIVNWDLGKRNVTHNAGRLCLKRYLAVMTNKKLRKKYFDF